MARSARKRVQTNFQPALTLLEDRCNPVMVLGSAGFQEIVAPEGVERQPIDFPIRAGKSNYGAVYFTVSVGGLPDYATLSAGVRQPDGQWLLGEGDLNGLTVTASHEGIADLTVSLFASSFGMPLGGQVRHVPLTVDDELSFGVRAGSPTGHERQPLPFPIQFVEYTPGTFTGVSEIFVTDLPEYMTLSAGRVDWSAATRTSGWRLTPDQLAGLTVTASHEGVANVTVVITADKGYGVSETKTRRVRIAADNVDPFPLTLDLPATMYAVRGQPLAFPIQPFLTLRSSDPYSSDFVLKDVLLNLPDGVTPSAGHRVPSGEWVLAPDQLEGLTITASSTVTASTVRGGRVGVNVSSRWVDGFTHSVADVMTLRVSEPAPLAVGGGGVVRLFDPAGALLRQIDAFPGFGGAVDVATGDLTGDGVPDVVAAAGAGGGPHVKVFDGATFAEVRSFYAYDERFTGGVSVAVGDTDGDGVPDIVTGAGPGGGPHVKVFSGASGAEIQSFYAYAESFTGGVDVAAGDLTADGYAEVVTGAGPGGGPHVKAFDGKSGAEVRSFYAYHPGFIGGVSVAAGDVDGDGRADVVTGAGPGGPPHVRVLAGTTGAELMNLDAYVPQFVGGLSVAVRDVDGDGAGEVVTGARSGGPHVKAFGGRTGLPVLDYFAFDEPFPAGLLVG